MATGYDEGDSIVHAEMVDKRIEELGREPLEPGTDEAEEYDKLIRFRDDAESDVHFWEGSFISGGYFQQWIEEEFEGLYGKEVASLPCVHLNEYADARQESFAEVTFGTTTYWGDGR